MNALLPLLLAAGSQPALAWKHTQFVWNSNDFPVEWWMSDHITTQLDAEYQVEVQYTAINNWPEDAPCAGIQHEYMGVRQGHWASGAGNDAINTIYYDDPAGQNDETALGVTYSNTAGERAFELRDPYESDTLNTYYHTVNSDIVYSEWVKWASTEAIDAGDCAGSEYSIESTSTHEFGHFWGMGHSCEETDVQNGDCTNLEWFDATMFWTGSACDISRTSLNEDDIAGITALYGPAAFFDAVSETSGGVPLEVCFELQTKGDSTEGLSVEWSFGDGATSTEFDPCHTYEEKGQFTVFVSVTGDDEECGDYSFDVREAAFVLACEAPQAAEGFGGLFTYEWTEDATYQMVNQADTSVYGCVNQVQWDVFKGGELQQSINAWSPKIDFGEDGTYEVVLNLGGPGGITAESITIEVGSEGGCSSVPAAAGLLGVLVGLGGALRRRRQS